jgi:AhpD family alkylhydroperoxidase
VSVGASRIPQVAADAIDDPELRAVLDRAARVSAPQPAWYLTLAHNPEVAKAYADYWETTHRGGRVEHTTKELMRIAIASALDCGFCATQRSVPAVQAGLDEDAARACALPAFDNDDARVRAAVRYARALATEPDPAAFDDVYAELHRVFDDAEIVELGCFAAIAIGGVVLSRSLQIVP